MLPGGALNINYSGGQTLFFGIAYGNPALLAVFEHIADGGFISHTGYCAGPEHIIVPEKLLNILMDNGLIYAGKVKVDIRRFVAVKAHKHLKGYIKALSVHFSAAFWARDTRKVKTAAVFFGIHIKIGIPAVRADIMRRQRIYLRNIRHSGGKRRAYGATGTHKIAIGKRFINDLMSNKIQHRKSVLDYGVKLFIKALFHYFG